jgi:hypothetical protein
MTNATPWEALHEQLAGSATGGEQTADRWPAPMREQAFHGLPGEFVTMVEPHTEADPHGLLVQMLAAAGNAIGRGPGYMADGAFHATTVWPVLVGVSAKSRKGTAWSRVREAMALADPQWAREKIEGGLSSGEGLAYQMRDERRERRKPRKGETPDPDGLVEALVDAGVSDKRLCVVETEFAQVFRVLQREGNTLSIALRTLWDFGQAGGMTKRDPTRVTGGHLCTIGHCTVDELRTVVSEVDIANGLVNRFLFCCVRRSKLLPDGGFVPHERLEEFASHLRDAIREAQTLDGALARTDEARELWHELYPQLAADRPGRLGQATSRAEAQVLRLSLIYAALDQRSVIDVEHLRAALAVWDYCAASAGYVFGESTGDLLADKILSALRREQRTAKKDETDDEGLTRTQIRELVGGRETEERLELALGLLDRFGLAEMEEETDTGGRPAERWRAATTTEEVTT